MFWKVERSRIKKNSNFNNNNIIGTKLILNLPELEPIVLGNDVGTKLIFGLPPLPPILDLENSETEKLSLVRKKALHDLEGKK